MSTFADRELGKSPCKLITCTAACRLASDHRESLLLGREGPLQSRSPPRRETERLIPAQGLCAKGQPLLGELPWQHRPLHAQTEQWNHKFSFDAHDPCVFHSSTVTGLLEHYKDPSSCMFFEPLLTRSLNRTFPFSLRYIWQAMTTCDGIDGLPLPSVLQDFLKECHYTPKARVRWLEREP
ncbi:hypothetical protein GH733_017551, partial [Mirounga leonina]